MFLTSAAMTRRNGEKERRQRAGERVRTVDNDVGNVVLYQLSYARFNQYGALYPVPSVLQDGGQGTFRIVACLKFQSRSLCSTPAFVFQPCNTGTEKFTHIL